MLSVLNPEVIQKLSDVGILICISTIVVVFVAKILDFLLTQAKTVSNSISPKLTSILSFLSVMKTEIVGTVTAHNTNTNSTFVKVLSKLEDIDKKFDGVLDQNKELLKGQKFIKDEFQLLSKQRSMLIDELVRRGGVTRDQIVDVVTSLEDRKK